MDVNSKSDREASLVIGPTSLGMVRILVESEGLELPMDFDPHEALEIADELRAAAERARASTRGSRSETARSPAHDRGGRGA